MAREGRGSPGPAIPCTVRGRDAGHTSTLCPSLGYLPNALRGLNTHPTEGQSPPGKNPANDHSASGHTPDRSMQASGALLPTFSAPRTPEACEPAAKANDEGSWSGRADNQVEPWPGQNTYFLKTNSVTVLRREAQSDMENIIQPRRRGRALPGPGAVCGLTAPRHVGRGRKRILSTARRGGGGSGLLHRPLAAVCPPKVAVVSNSSYSYSGPRSWRGGNLCFDEEDKMEARRGPSRPSRSCSVHSALPLEARGADGGLRGPPALWQEPLATWPRAVSKSALDARVPWRERAPRGAGGPLHGKAPRPRRV